MLTKLAIFNSTKHAKVIIKFDDATAIQIIGGNKIGKTTLIDALNFLYVIDSRLMSFDTRNGKSTYRFKESIHHFFPNRECSYIIFECFKANAGGYFCILVKRKTGGDDIEYFRINKQFDESDFLNANHDILKFSQLRKTFVDNIIRIKDKSELLKSVYNKDKRQNAFLWITDKVKRKGQAASNSLTKTYLHLLNAASIDDNALKEALIIADNKEGLGLNAFSDNQQMDRVEKLKQENEYLKKITAIKSDFEKFKLNVAQYKAKRKLVDDLLYSFDEAVKNGIKALEDEVKEREEQIESLRKQQDIFQPQGEELNRKIGRLEGDIEKLTNNKQTGEIDDKESQLDEINGIINQYPFYDTVDILKFLTEQKATKTSEYDSIKASLSSINQYNLTERQIKQKIEELGRQEQGLTERISKFDKSFIDNIADDKETREKFNAIFSDRVKNKFTNENIRKKVSVIVNIIRISDGKISGFDEIEPSPLEQKSDLEENLVSCKKEIKQQRDILETIVKRNEKEKKCENLEIEIKQIRDKIDKINQKENVESQIIKLRETLSDYEEKLSSNKSKATEIRDELNEINSSITKYNANITTAETNIKKYKDWYKEFEDELTNILPTDGLIHKPIEEIYKELRKANNEIVSLQSRKERQLENLRRITGNEMAEPIFIERIQQDILTIVDKEKSIETLLQQISNIFIEPVEKFLERYRHFEGYISSLNRTIKKYKISNLSSLKLVLKPNKILYTDLEKISKIVRIDADYQRNIFDSLNQKNQQAYLKILKSYTEKHRPVLFRELFDVELIAEDENGKSKRIRLKVGNESQGTIRMINLLLFLMVIKEFKVNGEENKLVFVIDEDKIDLDNTEQLISFCKENGFIILFAAKHQIIGLEKYYHLKERIQVNGEKKLIVDETHAQFINKKS